MVDQCIVCLENLDAALSTSGDPTPVAAAEGGGDRSLVVGESSSSSSTTATIDARDSTPSQPGGNGDVAVINACGHILHNSCLQEWAAKANSCPICRQSFHLVNVYDSIGGNLLKSYRVEDKKQVAEFDPRAWIDENPEEEEEEEPTPCPICNSAGDEDVLLLCDSCDASYHTYCIGLDDVPDGSWFCMECAPMLRGVEDSRPRRRAPASRRQNDFFPRTRASMRRARRRARSDEWQGAWGEITGRIFDALDIDLDSHDGDDALEEYRRSRQLREREQREYQRWQQRLNIARRQGAPEFAASIPNTLLVHSEAARENAASTPESREERRAWATLEKAREHNGEGPSGHRKRKSRSLTASPAEPPPEPERKLKRPRTRRIGASSEASSSKSEAPSAARAAGAAVNGDGDRNGGSASNARSPRPLEEAPSFLSSLLREVEQSNPSDDEAVRSLFGENRVAADASSPGSSPSASAYSSPRAHSLTPPPQHQARSTRPTSPTMSLSSHIEPIYPRANYLPNRSAGEASDSEARSSNQGCAELRQPRPRRSNTVRLPRSPDTSPTRPPLPFEMKESISSLVRTALKPHWKSSKLTAEQYANINRDVSRKLYEEITDPSSVDDEEARRAWEIRANQEVARAVSGLQA